jgi:hypothetical protein
MFDALGHAMLHAGWFKTLACAGCTKTTEFSGKRDEAEIWFAIWQRLDHFRYLYSNHSGFSTVLLVTGYLAREAARAVFVVY